MTFPDFKFSNSTFEVKLGQKGVFRIKGLKILGKVVTHIFFNYFFLSGKKYNFMHFERHLAFQNT